MRTNLRRNVVRLLLIETKAGFQAQCMQYAKPARTRLGRAKGARAKTLGVICVACRDSLDGR